MNIPISLPPSANFVVGPIGPPGAGGIDVRAFGALGNGVADDTSAIQAALTSLAAAGGGELRFPPGTYVTDEVVSSGARVKIVGSGDLSVLRKRAGGSNVLLRVLGDDTAVESLRLEAGGNSCYLMRANVDGAAPTSVKRLRVRGVTGIADARTAKGFFFGYYDGLLVEDCYLENLLASNDPMVDANTFGLTLHAGDNQFSRNATVKHNTVVGFYDGIESFGTGIRQHTQIDGNTVRSATNVGIYNYRGAQARVRGNLVDQCWGGIFADSSVPADLSTTLFGNTVEGNVVRRCTTYGILTEEHQGASIVGNTCTENRDGLVLGGGTADATITGNNCSYNTRYGIWTDKSLNPVQTHLYDLTLTGNVCKLNGADGIRLGGVKRSCIVANNQVVDNGTTASSPATSTHAGLFIGRNSDGSNASITLVHGNTFGNDINPLAGTGAIGKQGYGIFVESGGTSTMVIARGNLFDGNGQFNVFTGGNPVDLAGNHYRNGTNSIGASVPTAFVFEGQVLIPDGTVALPGLAFASDPDTGLRRSAANTAQLVAAGADTVQYNTGGLQATLPMIINDRLRITPESIKTTNYGAGNTDTVVVMDGTSLTLTLPATPATNQVMFIRNQNAGSSLTVGRNGQTINGAAADLTVAASSSAMLVHFTGSGWFVF